MCSMLFFFTDAKLEKANQEAQRQAQEVEEAKVKAEIQLARQKEEAEKRASLKEQEDKADVDYITAAKARWA